jgi:3-methylcrotonyl-CoA carboxylase alpha subunit
MNKVLIANRGEIACRVIRSCRALGLATVAVHSDPDAQALHVALADERVSLGGSSASDSYLRADALIEAARQTRADAIHPGYGFLAESEHFAAAVEAAGLVWVGPTPASIADMGDKERARVLARAAGVPVLQGSGRFRPGELGGIADAATAVGYPLLVKAAAGGGGIGMRQVERPEDLMPAVEATQGLAQRAFGDGTIYLERFIAQARHVEVQVFGFGDGRAIHLYERDCSIQRRFQKVIEESPAPGLASEALQAMYRSAVALCREERYRGAGTVEFVVDAATHEFFFLEMNTRIQVEHPVTEMLTGLDLVTMQLQLAAGRPCPVSDQSEVRRNDQAIECRLYAERPAKGFLPSTGELTRFDLPETTPFLRVDTGVRPGDRISHFYDPMIAKLIARGTTRIEAIDRLIAALDGVRIEGVETNLAFLRRALDHPAFRAAELSTGFVDLHKAQLI